MAAPPQPKKVVAPTVSQINAEFVTQLACEYWAPHIKKKSPFDPKVIEDIYEREIVKSRFAIRKIMLLEFSQYLENYLWLNYSPEVSSKAYFMSICCMVNEKFRENVPAWETFKRKPEHFPFFFKRILEALLAAGAEEPSLPEQTILLLFLDHCFNSLEVDLIRNQVQQLISLPMWLGLQPARLELELKKTPKLKKFWNLIRKNDEKMDPKLREEAHQERRFLSQLIQRFISVLKSIPLSAEPVTMDKVHYCERFIELMIDLEALLPTRRWFNTVLDDSHLVVHCSLSNLVRREEDGHLFSQLLDMLRFYAGFEINDQTGNALTENEMTTIHYDRITSLQRAAFAHFPELYNFALSNVAAVDTRGALMKLFVPLSSNTLHQVASHLCLLPPLPESQDTAFHKEFLLELLVSRHERRISQIQQLNQMPLYPTEKIIWDENIVPTEYYSGEGCLALPKLNLQFLTLHDYLLRNFNLFRLESTYEIRQDIEDSVSRMKPWQSEYGGVVFGGWARMAQPIVAFTIVEVAKPKIGENWPARVRADVTVNLNVRDHIKDEWQGLRKHDVCFLITVRPTKPYGTKFDRRRPFVEQIGLVYVRGCEVQGVLDDKGRVIEDGPEPKPRLRGDSRTFRVFLDPNQYQQDMTRTIQNGAEDVYETFNIIMRRKPKENNFKAVLETIRDLMNTECVVPDWLHDIILGYGDPGSAHYSKMPNQIARLDFNDTFLSMDHLRASFPGYSVKVTAGSPDQQVPPFRITFPGKSGRGKKRKDADGEGDGSEEARTLIVEPHVIPNRGPYPYNQPKRNTIQFTHTQIEAIRAGMQPGLTMVVGPPGTGKTDVAVQIISNLYHNFPEQRTLIVTHSNQALNQLFEKIMALDIDERHLLRLGHGEEELETEKDFSRYGRVNYVLARRLELLREVGRLQESLGVPGDVSYTCETAGHFFLYQVMSRWEEYMSKVKGRGARDKPDVADVSRLFPFHKYFANAPQPVFRGSSYAEDMEIAEGCFRHLRKIFTQLEEFRAFELLRSGLDRSKYLLVKEAKIIAMTCTHAALKRHDLVELGFKYDNILMEESAQILEIETFIPLLLQNPQDGFSRLKRWIMIGDHHQLPPVVKNMAFQKYSNMEQSLFTRFVRGGVPTVDLDAQGRARASLCNLYNWRYKNLGNLPHVQLLPEFRTANAGLLYDFQLVNVEDFHGVGESEPNPYFYQNLGEAEYVVALFMYMCLLGYPADKISILTTYNGQKHLIRDVINQRCGNNPLIGRPNKVTTVDRFQGQQNDYILLSLVRTRAVGHLRDVRRLVVAMSRARLGLYIFARVALFQNCFELTPAFSQLTARPLHLHIVPTERFPTDRKNGAHPAHPVQIVKDTPQMANFVYNMYLHMVQSSHCYRQTLPPPPALVEDGEPAPSQEARMEATTEADTEATAEAGTEATAEAGTEAATEAGTEAAAEAGTEAAAEAGTEAAAEAGTEAATEAGTEAAAEVGTEAAAEAGTEAAAEAGTEAAAEAGTEAAAETGTEATAETGTEAKMEAEVEARMEAETEAETETRMEAETEAEKETRMESETEARTEAEVEARKEAEAEAETETRMEAETAAKKETGMEAETEAETETGMEAETEAETETRMEAETEAKKETGMEAETEAETETRMEAETEAKKETGMEAETEAETETRMEAEAEARTEIETEARTSEAEGEADTSETGVSEKGKDGTSSGEGPQEARRAPSGL
ncbi:RNA helicase aquarius isoform X2 [Tachyglossus aculeatus]|uniref:RNA helicase aquarius isoform X2 n=1 Tax=Tachyglossus aculeatus TaxID=9261 RepID=UPI0018F306A4|nr:RNA helicase aquarius isoform X2 [Tachyglossus aculeatus]